MNPLAEEALDYIRAHPTTSFAELEGFLLGCGMEVYGEMCLEVLHNVILWAGISQEFVDLAKEIRPYLDVTPSTPLVYLIDGRCLTFPIAKRPPKNGYRDPHWVPAVMSVKAGS